MGEPGADDEWLARVNRGDKTQLTVRAVIAGMVLGAVMALSNLYVVLKTGWSLGVTVTASILGFALFRALSTAGLVRRPLGMLENSAIGSVASAAGYMTGGGNMAALPALLMLTGTRPPAAWMVLWFAVIAALGVCAAIPLKRQLVNVEKLPFPTGTAAGETLLSLHASGASTEKARLLGISALLGVVIAWFRDAKAAWMPFNIRAQYPLPLSWGGFGAGAWTVGFEGSLILAGAGALTAFRVCWSMLLGAFFNYCVLAPRMVEAGAIKLAKVNGVETVTYKGIMQFSLWPGAAMLLSSGLLAFAFQWRSVVRSFRGLKVGGRAGDASADVECPDWWFPAGFALLGPVVVFLMAHLFGMPWWSGVIALPLAVAMGIVAARVTGETDVTPTKALGPVTQCVYGAILPGNLPANLMGANVTGGVGLHAADLLLDLRAGWLVGANPRQQFKAQLFGVVAGALAVVPVFNLLVPNADAIGGVDFPAPGVQVWAGVSKVLVGGVGGLHPLARTAAELGFVVGIALVLLERWAPKKLKPFVPSPSGLGLAFVIPGYNAVAMFLGSLAAELVRRRSPELAERAVVPISSGFIAGESIMGVIIAVLIAFGVLTR